MRSSATELNKRLEAYMHESLKEPVIIEKTGSPFVVIVPYEQYIKLEDAYWGELSVNAEQEKSLGLKKSKKFLVNNE